MSGFYDGLVLGAAQANAIGGAIGTVVLVACGSFTLAPLLFLISLFGIAVWRSLGWAWTPSGIPPIRRDGRS